MCDCAETFHRKCCPQPGQEPEEPAPPSPNYLKAMLLALLCGAIGYLLYSLDRRTIKKILTMLGLGFLFAEKAAPGCTLKPDPCKKPDPCAPKYLAAASQPKDCKCKIKNPASCSPAPKCTCCPTK